MKDTNKRAHGDLRHFGTHKGLFQSEERQCLQTHCKDNNNVTVSSRSPQGEMEGLEGKEKESYLRFPLW